MFSFIQQVFEQNKFPEQLYKTCDGIFSMARKTEISVFNKACQIALKHKNFSYGFIKNLIQNKMTDQKDEQVEKELPEHKNIRGKQYYQQQTLKF